MDQFVWLVSRPHEKGLTPYAIKTSEEKAVMALEARRRYAIDKEGVPPDSPIISHDGEDWVLGYMTPEGETIQFVAEKWQLDCPSAFGEPT